MNTWSGRFGEKITSGGRSGGPWEARRERPTLVSDIL